MRRLPQCRPALVLALSLLLISAATAVAGTASPTMPAAGDDVAGRVDIGGRRIYLECRGTGSPTVVLESGYRGSGRYWSQDILQPKAPRTMVFAGVAASTHVCLYDRPGTVAQTDDGVRPSRSDPVAQPRTAPDLVADLHALLHTAGVPGPYVLAGQSLGGIVVRLYAANYPDEVAGIVLVDAISELIEPLLMPEQWAAVVRLNVESGSDTVLPIQGYGELETIGYTASPALMRQVAAATPLRPMPLAVLAHGRPFDVTEEALGFPPAAMEMAFLAAQEQLAQLVPNGRLFVARDSGHDIHQEQPALVTEAIRQVVVGVRSPDTWSDLASCCAR